MLSRVPPSQQGQTDGDQSILIDIIRKIITSVVCFQVEIQASSDTQ
jgi:hypothetical protein